MRRSNAISELMESSSWIRAMFEESEKLKSVYGQENIFDLTLGNPIAEQPAEAKQELLGITCSETEGDRRCMTNSGYEEVRAQISKYWRGKTGQSFTKDHTIMIVGCAGGINVVIQSIQDPGRES
jgi:aspartate aminotransferase